MAEGNNATAVATASTGSNGLTLRDRLESPDFAAALRAVLPKHVTPERMVRCAITAMTRNEKLRECDQASFFKCMLDLSQWGLEPDGRRAHLIPFANNKRGVVECQLIIDYKGLAELAYRTGVVKAIHADVVRRGDLFTFNAGVISRHVPHFLRNDSRKPKEAGEIYAVYCIATLADDAHKSEVMSVEEIETIRKRSPGGNSGPWKDHWSEMARKTAFRRLSKWLPLSAEIRDAVDRDDSDVPATENDVLTLEDVDKLFA